MCDSASLTSFSRQSLFRSPKPLVSNPRSIDPRFLPILSPFTKSCSSVDLNPRISTNNFSPSRIRSHSTATSGNSDENKAKKHESVEKLVVDGEEKEIPSSFDFLELKRELEKEESGNGGPDDDGDDELVPLKGSGRTSLDLEGSRARNGRQVMRRSSLLAKQVISIRSACSLGFVSQLWVDARSWMVILVEVRPNLLSGENEKFLLEDVHQVGDVLLVQDESVMENELKMVGLDTLVGYNVVTSARRNVGKVRGYSFNINSGAVESLELDSFGFSVIPASLVSTYCLFVEDVLEVASDTVVVQEGAISRLQRLTKGIWDRRNVDPSGDYMEEPYDFGRGSVQSRRDRNFSARKSRRKMRVGEDDWELPLDY